MNECIAQPIHLAAATQTLDMHALQRAHESPEDRKMRELRCKLQALRLAYPQKEGIKSDGRNEIRKISKKIRQMNTQKEKRLQAEREARSSVKIQSIVRRGLAKTKQAQLRQELESKKRQGEIEAKGKEEQLLQECKADEKVDEKAAEKAAAKAAKRARQKAAKKAKAAEKKALAAEKKALAAEKKALAVEKKAQWEYILKSASLENRQSICKELLLLCKSSAQRELIALIIELNIPIHFVLDAVFSSHILTLLSEIEKGRYRKSELKSILAKEDEIDGEFITSVHTFIMKQLETLPCPKDTVEIGCKSSEDVLSLSRKLLLRIGDCSLLCTASTFKIDLSVEKDEKIACLQSWVQAIAGGVDAFKHGLKSAANSIPHKASEMETTTFKEYKNNPGKELFLVFKILHAILHPNGATDRLLQIKKELLLADLNEGGLLSWLPGALDQEERTNGLDATVSIWMDLYEKEPVEGTGKKIWDALKGSETSYYHKIIDLYTQDIKDKTLVQKVKNTVDEAIAIGFRSHLDRLSLLNSIMSFTNKEEKIPQINFESYLKKRIETLSKEDLQNIQTCECHDKKDGNSYIVIYLRNLTATANVFHKMYKETIKPMYAGAFHISYAAGKLFTLGKDMEDAGL
ncbi:MAG: hypothetical protein SP4CHLAM5_00550 [Chlamydiia bacterium]|nr:hypothetical protein [Chlamydiia bacterium]MCH9617932.1 hypothetical protein [Chlamydiia bacterium]